MLKLCDDIQLPTGMHHQELPKYSRRVEDIVSWYRQVYDRYASKLQMDKGSETSPEGYDAVYEVLGKEKLLNNIEALFRLALSKFSYGPSDEFKDAYKIHKLDNKHKSSWLDYSSTVPILAETLARVLEKAKIEYSFDLNVLAADRKERNKEHQGGRVKCAALIRKYRSVRNLLIFLDPTYEDLSQFDMDFAFDYDRFIGEPCRFGFGEMATVLIADSVHDIPKGRRSLVANLPWDIIIDFDGYSHHCGLMSSVTHNRFRKPLLLPRTSPSDLPIPDPSQTLWYRCGDYLLPDYYAVDSFEIAENSSFLSSINEQRHYPEKTAEVFGAALGQIISLQKFVNIVLLTDDHRLVSGVIRTLRNLSCDDYFLTWIGLSNSDIFSDYEENEGDEYCEEHALHQRCPISSFFETINEYRASWPVRESVNLDYALPVGDGCFVSLSENDRNNLLPYFDTLYIGIETVDLPKTSNENAFIKGGQATWWDIAIGEALQLDIEKVDKLYDKIKSATGKGRVDNPQQKLFFVSHKAGIGGTTFVKQVAWKLHKEIAVLEIKHYDDKKLFPLLQNLYDNIMGTKPILLIAEDTLANIGAMCDAFLTAMSNRRCALLVACREGNNLYKKYKKAPEPTQLNQLRDKSIDALKNKYQSVSRLSPADIQKKSADFSTNITGEMCTPFIIGLYYFEKDFQIESYVAKILDGNLLASQKEMIALLAFCDIYNNKYLPQMFVNKLLGYDPRKRNSLLQTCPGAESLICQGKTDQGISVYYFKHRLLSEQYFKLYCQGKGTIRYDLAEKLIRYASEYGPGDEKEYIINVLLDILIKEKSADDYGGKLSQLLTDIAVPESQRSLIECLAIRFEPNAARLLSEKDPDNWTESDKSCLRIVSHAYAHLGKLYTRTPQNYEKAIEYLDKAEKYMPYDDPYIFHMYGNALFHQMSDEWKDAVKDPYSEHDVSAEMYEERVDEAFDLFGRTIEAGDPSYGITGQLNLLYGYLKFIYTLKEICSKDDFHKLSAKQKSYQALLMDTLDTARLYDFEEDTMRFVQRMADQLRSEVLMGDFGKTIEYYQNEYDKLRNSNDTDYVLSVLYSLVSARIQKARDENRSKRSTLYHLIPNQRVLFEQIETLLPPLYNQTSYSAYVRRSSLFHHWFQLSKLLDQPLNNALTKVNTWVDIEDEVPWKKNPEPYYYKAAILYLDILEGERRENELRIARDAISRMRKENKFDPKRGNPDRMRDLIVTGSGMGRMLDISDCSSAEDIAGRIIYAKKTVMDFAGRVEDCDYRGAKLRIYDPYALRGQTAHTEVGRLTKNSLSEQQNGDRVKFFAGFNVGGLKAVSDSVKDQDTNEVYDAAAIISEMDSGGPSGRSKLKESGRTDQKEPQRTRNELSPPSQGVAAPKGEKKVFSPKHIRRDDYGQPLHLNGTADENVSHQALRGPKVDGGTAAISPGQPKTEEAVPLPDFSGKRVELVLNDLKASSLCGKFVVDGIEYSGKLVGAQTKKELKYIQEHKGKVSAVIRGKAQAGQYSLKISLQ